MDAHALQWVAWMGLLLEVSMKIQNFFKWIWKDNVEFVKHLLSDIVKIVLTIGSLKIIIIIVDIVVTEKLIIIRYMEMAAHIGILLIFVIYIVRDIYNILRETIKGGEHE